MNDSMGEVTTGCIVFDKFEDIWQLKWPPVTHLAWSWQLVRLACEVSHNNQFLTSFSLVENPMHPSWLSP